MQFDDRLATVLRMRTDSDGGLRTQFRQLLDLIGTSPDTADADLLDRAYARLRELGGIISQDEQSHILRQGALRLRDVRLVGFLADQDAKLAASAMATARLTEAEWLAIIPDLPVNSRGFLRHRRDLPAKVRDLLARLGVQDLVLPDFAPQERVAGNDTATTDRDGEAVASIEATADAVDEAAVGTGKRAGASRKASGRQDEIGVLLRRIAQFRQGQRTRPVAPRLPLEDDGGPEPVRSIEFLTGADGEIRWAEPPLGPLLGGMRLASTRPVETVIAPVTTRRAFAAHQPVRQAAISIDIRSDIGGDWCLDAVPLFDPLTGSFTGYRGCLRRPVHAGEAAEVESEGDRMRQVLHELRTPVNAIQGFAEIIQQQLFGAVPHEYRAHAAAVAVDAARLMAGFDEVDRLVKLESGAMDLTRGEADMRQCIAETVERLQGILRPRNAGFSLTVSGPAFTVALDRSEVLLLAWRLLASIAAALAPGETADLVLASDGDMISLDMAAPEAMNSGKWAENADSGRARAVSAGVFGSGFALRLARAEAENAGGQLKCKRNRITVMLPALTGTTVDSSPGAGRVSG